MLEADLYRQFRRDAVNYFTLEVRIRAETGFTILFGASGAGKSLTLQLLAGIERPDRGTIRIGDETVFDHTRHVNVPIRRRGVGLVFQSLALFPHLSVHQNVAYGLPQLTAREKRERTGRMLERLKIGALADHGTQDLSGGEQQRVALARALVTKPKILLLDEPLSALDAAVKRSIIVDLKQLNQEMRIPVLYVTHDRAEALALGENLVMVEAGRIVAQGSPLGILGHPQKEGVANLTGVENIFDAQILEKHPERGTMTCDAGGCHLEVAYLDWPSDKALRIGLRSGDILLAVQLPEGLSAQNVLRGRIERVEPADYEVQLRVHCGRSFQVTMTRAAAETLRLESGREVWLIFKAHSCHVLL